MKKRANDRAFNIGKLKNSITSGKGNLAACLGEDAVKQFLGGRYTRGKDKKDYDITINGKKIEVKTKRRTVFPKLNYSASVAATSRHQSPEYYVFTSVTYKQEKPVEVVILGYMEYEEFIKEAKYIKRGSKEGFNNFRAHANMYNIEHSQLKPISQLKNA